MAPAGNAGPPDLSWGGGPETYLLTPPPLPLWHQFGRLCLVTWLINASINLDMAATLRGGPDDVFHHLAAQQGHVF